MLNCTTAVAEPCFFSSTFRPATATVSSSCLLYPPSSEPPWSGNFCKLASFAGLLSPVFLDTIAPTPLPNHVSSPLPSDQHLWFCPTILYRFMRLLLISICCFIVFSIALHNCANPFFAEPCFFTTTFRAATAYSTSPHYHKP